MLDLKQKLNILEKMIGETERHLPICIVGPAESR